MGSVSYATYRSDGHPDSPRTGVDLARDTLRDMIVRGEIEVGSRVILADVAKRIGTSVTPVREALRDLAASGLVDIDAHKGARVHASSAAELTEIYSLRSLLESRAMAEVAALAEEDRIVACTIASRLVKQIESETDMGAWTTLNHDLHACLVEPLRTRWPLLFNMIETLRNRSMLPVAKMMRDDPALAVKANRYHRTVVTAIRKGDPAKAAHARAEHLDRVINIMLKSFESPAG
ncbi:GntR family transcriptional regulator [Mycobacterium shigaense]|uniref:GntR family transcriptional regulator n=1 Tax=Mycobacterium shigaense TaxID=722731 RepID=A0A1Z4EBW0_9MYCO|nr:GntR family transcriptional regulator [Mycobacterium shigaense]BAX90444.1 GntR family transcriptional regulator [Mycobacterium shigaense]